MSSPFAAFRKNQKVLMAAITILAVVAFVILPQLDRTLVKEGYNPEMVSTKYGKLAKSDLDQLAHTRMVANQFIHNVLGTAGFQAPENFFGDPQDRVSLVQSMISAEKAQEMGIQVTDDQIVAIMDQLTNKRLTGEQFANITRNMHVTEMQVMDAMRQELLAMQFQQMDFTGTRIPTPYDQWKLFESLNRYVNVEAAPLRVESFVSKVPKPGEAALLAFFEQYKDQEPSARGGTPGFRLPKRVALQYFRVRHADFVAQVQVTDEEIAARYERDKHLYPYPSGDAPAVRNPFATQGATMDSGVPKEGEEPITEPVAPVTPGEAPADGGPAATVPGDAALPGTETPPTDGAVPAEGQSLPTEDTSTPAEAPGTDKPAAEGAPQSAVRRSPFRLTAYQQDAPASSTETAPAAATEAPATGGAPTAPATETAAAPAETAPAGDAAPTGDAAPAVEATAAVEPEPEYQLPLSLQDGPTPQFQPLWMAKEQVRQSIADEKAFEMMNKVISDLNREMRSYEQKRRAWLATVRRDATAKEPAPLNFDDLARKYGVEAKETPLLGAEALLFSDEYPIGKCALNGDFNTTAARVVIAAYGSMPLYQTQDASGPNLDRYLFWKTEEKDAETTQFADVKGLVEEQLKFQEARKLALAEAEKLAEEARKSGKSLKEAFAARPDVQVITPREFSWRFGGFMGMAIRNSTVEGVPDAGDRFMRVVYGLGVGDVGVATDEPEAVVYVVQLESSNPDVQGLYNRFLTTPFQTYSQAGSDEQLSYRRDWLQQLDRQANLQWLTAPQAE